MKVKFLQDRKVQDSNVGTNRETSFRKNQVVDLPEASAHHWISRGVAESFEAPPKSNPTRNPGGSGGARAGKEGEGKEGAGGDGKGEGAGK